MSGTSELHDWPFNQSPPPAPPAPRQKASHVGAPACFKLELCCQQLQRAFDGRCYLVGSALDRADRRDIDVRMIMGDEAFSALFPDADTHWEFDTRWLLMTTTLSDWLAVQTGLPIDFQFQPRTHANELHKGMRHALGMSFVKGDPA